MTDEDPQILRYDDPDPEQVATPEPGLYDSVADARNEVLSLDGFSDAVLKPSRA